MMNVESFAKRNFYSLATSVVLLAGTMGLSSCLDDNDPIKFPPVGYISIYNGAPNNAGVIMYADQKKVNDGPLKYSEVLPYKSFIPGDRLFKFSEGSSLTSLLERKFEIKEDSVYSLFLVEDAGELNAVLVEDNWSDPIATQAQIRMLNLSPDAGAISLKLDAVETPVFSTVPFKSNSIFKSLPNKAYKLTVVSSTGVPLATATNVDLKGNRVYTLVVRGYKEATDNTKKLDLQLLTNFVNY